MNKIVILNRKKIQLYAVIAAVVILAGAYIGWQQTKPAMAPAGAEAATQVLHMTTGEFTAQADGKKLKPTCSIPVPSSLKKASRSSCGFPASTVNPIRS